MTTTPNMGINKPTLDGDAGTWDDKVNAGFDKIDAHDHSTGKGTAVKTNGISLDADLTFSSLYAPINLHRITFASIVALTGSNKSLFVNTADNELYWRSNAGTNVKLTNGSALNVAAFTGGIGGDYTAVGAAVAFDDAGDRYTFKQQSNVWARMASGDVRLFETGTSETVFVGLGAPSALAGSYTITMPLTAPAATHPIQMTSTGVLQETGSIAMASNESVTVSGTGRFKHGTLTQSLPATAFIAELSATAMSYNGGSLFSRAGLAGAITVYAPIVLDVGKRILAIRVFVVDSGVGPTKLQASFNSAPGAGGSITVIASSAVSAGNATNQTLTIGSLTTTVAASSSYFIKVTTTTGTDSNGVFMAEVDYDHP